MSGNIALDTSVNQGDRTSNSSKERSLNLQNFCEYPSSLIFLSFPTFQNNQKC